MLQACSDAARHWGHHRALARTLRTWRRAAAAVCACAAVMDAAARCASHGGRRLLRRHLLQWRRSVEARARARGGHWNGGVRRRGGRALLELVAISRLSLLHLRLC